MAADLSREPSGDLLDKCDSSGFAAGVSETNVANSTTGAYIINFFRYAPESMLADTGTKIPIKEKPDSHIENLACLVILPGIEPGLPP